MERTPSTEAVLLNSVLDLAERDKNEDAELAVLERLVELQPDNHNVRFNLAFKHSDQGNNELALYHYLMIPAAERSAIVWNIRRSAGDKEAGYAGGCCRAGPCADPLG